VVYWVDEADRVSSRSPVAVLIDKIDWKRSHVEVDPQATIYSDDTSTSPVTSFRGTGTSDYV